MPEQYWNNLRSAQGVNISLCYAMEDFTDSYGESYVPRDLRVYATQLPGGSLMTARDVRAVLINRTPLDGGGVGQQVWEFPLVFDGPLGDVLAFVGSPHEFIKVWTPDGEAGKPSGQIAVCVRNGDEEVWQQDPWQGWGDGTLKHNFNFAWLGLGG